MNKFQEELAALLQKYNATIHSVEHDTGIGPVESIVCSDAEGRVLAESESAITASSLGARPPSKYHLYVETDYDFSLEFRGEVYMDYEFTIGLESVEAIDEIVILGPWGAKDCGRASEVLEWFERIKANPEQSHSRLGGNRGYCWSING